MAKDVHRHDYTKLGHMREAIVGRIILFRSCTCGEKQAFECGGRDEMRKLYAKLLKIQEGTNAQTGFIQSK